MNNYKLKIYAILCAVLLLVSNVVIADDKSGEEINWQVISSGGDMNGTSTNYGLQGTVSQTATGGGASTNYGLKHGFWQVFGTPCEGECGDANGDESVNVSDAVYIINYVFVGGDAPLPLACGNANNDTSVNVSDAVYIINYVFVGGDAPGDCSPGAPAWIDGDCCEFIPAK